MAEATLTRPQVILKDTQNVTISTHDFEFQAVAAADEQLPSTYTIERPTVTITVTA